MATHKLEELVRGLDFEAGKEHQLTVPMVRRVRLVGMFFDSSKCFLLPSAIPGLQAIKEHYDAHPQSKLLLVGHTDTSGRDAYNETLSLERADAVAAYLTDKTDAWEAFFGADKAPEKRWGALEVQHMLSRLPEKGPFLYRGTPNGVKDPAHDKAVRAYQQSKGLSVDGIAGPKTCKALIADYMALDRTSLPSSISITTHGCGENFPVTDTADGVRNPDNRRVEMFFFDDAIEPPPPAKISKKGSTAYPQWLAQVGETFELGQDGVEETGDTILSGLPLTQFKGLAEKRGEDFFVLWMATLFGTDIEEEVYRKFHQDLVGGIFEMPPVVLVKDEALKGRAGAYHRKRKRIEVAESEAKKAVDGDNLASWTVLVVLVEEFGHHIDDHIRQGFGDAEEDEGAKFGYSLLNLDWNTQSSAEIGKLRLLADGSETPIRVDWSEAREKVEQLLNEREQEKDDRDEEREYFGAGKLHHDSNPHSWGHQAIEEAVLKKRQNLPKETQEIYFGNWLRDYSQVLTPLTLQWASPEALTKFIHVLAHAEFGLHSKYDVTQIKLGQYQFQEHIDHPFGNPGTQAAWSEFNHDTLTPKYLGTGNKSAGIPNSAQYIRDQLSQAAAKGPTPEGRRHLGQALHTLEDYYAHSNFCELLLIQLGHTGVSSWTTGRIHNIAPIVTGSFTMADTAASLILGVAEHVGKAKDCEIFEERPSFMMKAAFILLGEIIKGADTLSEKKGELQKLWDEWADKTMELLHFAMEHGLLDDHPLANAAQKTVIKFFAYVHCQISNQISKFSAAIIAAAADFLFAKVLEHEVHFDGTLGSAIHDLGTELGHAQLAVAGSGIYPSHTQLAKDHDDHPLHDLAAQMAGFAVGEVFDAMVLAWKGRPNSASPGSVATSFLVHPAVMAAGSAPEKLIAVAEDWAKGNASNIHLAGTPTWIEHHRQELRECRKKAREIAAGSVGEKYVDMFFDWVKQMLKDGPQ
jgi:outer membrane protein OmpA-like peptidoglycan-associated protein